MYDPVGKQLSLVSCFALCVRVYDPVGKQLSYSQLLCFVCA